MEEVELQNDIMHIIVVLIMLLDDDEGHLGIEYVHIDERELLVIYLEQRVVIDFDELDELTLDDLKFRDNDDDDVELNVIMLRDEMPQVIEVDEVVEDYDDETDVNE